MFRQMLLVQFKKPSVFRVWIALAGLSTLCACSESSRVECLSEEGTDYKWWEYPYGREGQLEKAEASLPEDDEKKFLPFRKHKEIDFPVHWMYFDRPIMLYIDDPPRLDDSLFIY